MCDFDFIGLGFEALPHINSTICVPHTKKKKKYGCAILFGLLMDYYTADCHLFRISHKTFYFNIVGSILFGYDKVSSYIWHEDIKYATYEGHLILYW